MCHLNTKIPRLTCPNCGSNLLLFAKIKLNAQDFRKRGMKNAANALYRQKEISN